MKTFKEFDAFFDATLSQDEKLSVTSFAGKVRLAFKDKKKSDKEKSVPEKPDNKSE